jgi:hypothetical protein
MSEDDDMEPIKRIGPPTPTGVRGTEYELTVPLNATPSTEWRRTFQAPEEWKDPCHPSRITVRNRSLVFASEERHVGLWIQLIDQWITAANQKLADSPESVTRQQVAQAEQEREQVRRLDEATERFKDF